jgi:hypothetical protein
LAAPVGGRNYWAAIGVGVLPLAMFAFAAEHG